MGIDPIVTVSASSFSRLPESLTNPYLTFVFVIHLFYFLSRVFVCWGQYLSLQPTARELHMLSNLLILFFQGQNYQ